MANSMNDVEFSAPRPITPEHTSSEFSCGEDALDEWLKKKALKNEAAGASRTYVVCTGNAVAAYYSLAVGSVAHEFSPGPVRRNMPDPIPVMILARLAVDSQYKGRGLGTALVRDALLRSLQVARITGIRALLVHALNENAAIFYKNLGFISSPFDPLILFLQINKLTLS